MAAWPPLLALAWAAVRSSARVVAGGHNTELVSGPEGDASVTEFCCMSAEHGDACGNCAVQERHTYCGSSRSNCEGCRKVWCSTAAGRPTQDEATVGASEPRAGNASTTAGAGDSQKGSRRRRGSGGGREKTEPDAGNASPPRGAQGDIAAEETGDAPMDVATSVTPTTSTMSTISNTSATRTSTGTTTSASTGTATATVTSTSTVLTATTHTKRRYPFPSMMCWLLFVVSSYELDLVKSQCDNKVSIWRCDEHIPFSDHPVELCGGESTVAVGDMTSKVSEWGSWSNTGNFLRAWGMVISDGRFRKHEWVVKVDADSVFYPERLRRQLEPLPQQEALFLHNWRESFGFLGPIEVLSAPAVERFGEGNKTCADEIGVEDTGEDGYLDTCLRRLKVAFQGAFGLLDFSGNVDACGNGDIAAFHPFKSWDKFSECMSRGPPMEEKPPPPTEERDESEAVVSDEEDGSGAHEKEGDGGDVPGEEAFCCSAAEDPSDPCGTCWEGARVGREDYCGKSRHNCRSCAQTWCEAGGDSHAWMRAFSDSGLQEAHRFEGTRVVAAAGAAVALAVPTLAAGLAMRSRHAARGVAVARGLERLALVAADGATTEV